MGTCHAPGVGANADDELRLVPGFRELADAFDVLAAALEASHMLPADRLGDLLRQAGQGNRRNRRVDVGDRLRTDDPRADRR